MTAAPKILAFAGSTRQASFNRKLLRIAVDGAKSAGGEVTMVELADYPLPLFNQDDESARGIPENGRKLKELMKSHRGFLLACPEYNSSITPLLKNTIDWTSRLSEGEKPLECYAQKAAILMSASPGALGGLRGLVHVRAILGNIGTLVLPGTISISQAASAFDADGQLVDAAKQATVRKLATDLVEFLRKWQA
jgi:chromate reductase, NAD(P)H dehydrogenase (quinone)